MNRHSGVAQKFNNESSGGEIHKVSLPSFVLCVNVCLLSLGAFGFACILAGFDLQICIVSLSSFVCNLMLMPKAVFIGCTSEFPSINIY